MAAVLGRLVDENDRGNKDDGDEADENELIHLLVLSMSRMAL